MGSAHGIWTWSGVGPVPCVVVPHDALPPDPFAGDPEDPARALGPPDDDHDHPPMDDVERTELIGDLSDLAVYQALLEPRGVRGIVVDCGECQEPHYHDWALLRSSLEQLLSDGRMRPHEPAYDPDPVAYVSWEYCRGYADGVTATENAR
ncbi:DUF5319 domain-containing protein [Saccharothrix algeriensis]|uniref:DUF5319 domain-containing protein n=1 Tax=Saccharothrix algeriensis TaxID=173560 RepID=A0A8T8HSH4_9PSEU|nr:DUF5319 domain-containing protein [Saccharothrix algeriensis]QTR01436.1 DUF5319 domain-containing protein [Saccharothrix algeriensis]